MKFLLDANLSPRLTRVLAAAGYNVAHVQDFGLLASMDSEIFDYAANEDFVIITADSDFSMLVAARGTDRPSVVLLRHAAELRADAHGKLLQANLPAVMGDLRRGAIVSLSPTRLAVRLLPVSKASEIEATS